MPAFSRASRRRLATCDERLQRVLRQAIRHVDFAVIEGHRSAKRQEALYRKGASQLRAGQSKHNAMPSLAVDVAPWPIDFRDRERFCYLAGFLMAIAAREGIRLRWGGDWDGDGLLADNRFDDLGHFELIED